MTNAVHIADMRAAIAAGQLPGRFVDGRRAFEFDTLVYQGARGAEHRWTIRVRLLRGAESVPITDRMLAQPVPELDGDRAEITVEASQTGGKVRDVVPTYVSSGKNLGKKNATNALTQALRDALGLHNKQRKRVALVSEEKAAPDDAAEGEAAKGETAEGEAAEGAEADEAEPAAGPKSAKPGAGDFDETPPPMLVKKYGETQEATLTPADFKSGVTAQPKLDGIHFVAFYQRDAEGRPADVVRYSRTGTRLLGQARIAAELVAMGAAVPPVAAGAYGVPAAAPLRVLEAYGAAGSSHPGDPRPYFAGELYLHGKPLNWISGQARRSDDAGALEFHIFDVFFPYAKAAGHDMASRDRQAYLNAFFAGADAAGAAHPHVQHVPNTPVGTLAELNELAKRFLAEGYEGAIARKDAAGYRYGYGNYHSANLVKIKPRPDDEFPVVGFTQGTRGKDVGAVIWECAVPHPLDPRDARFTVVPNMPLEQRRALFRCLSARVPGPDGRPVTRFERDLKGTLLTVEYAGLSAKTGKPLQPKAKAFRTYEQGEAADPVARLLRECAGEAE